MNKLELFTFTHAYASLNESFRQRFVSEKERECVRLRIRKKVCERFGRFPNRGGNNLKSLFFRFEFVFREKQTSQVICSMHHVLQHFLRAMNFLQFYNFFSCDKYRRQILNRTADDT